MVLGQISAPHVPFLGSYLTRFVNSPQPDVFKEAFFSFLLQMPLSWCGSRSCTLGSSVWRNISSTRLLCSTPWPPRPGLWVRTIRNWTSSRCLLCPLRLQIWSAAYTVKSVTSSTAARRAAQTAFSKISSLFCFVFFFFHPAAELCSSPSPAWSCCARPSVPRRSTTSPCASPRSSSTSTIRTSQRRSSSTTTLCPSSSARSGCKPGPLCLYSQTGTNWW